LKWTTDINGDYCTPRTSTIRFGIWKDQLMIVSRVDDQRKVMPVSVES
jgi:hypothetical protein